MPPGSRGGLASPPRRAHTRRRIAAAAVALARGTSRGVVTGAASPIEWNFEFDPTSHPAERGPRWLHRLPTPTRVVHANQEVPFRGTVRVGEREHVVTAASGVQKHLWGTRRVEELFWIYAPALVEGGAFEASSVRMTRGRGLAITPVWLHDGGRAWTWWGVPGLFRNCVEPAGPGALRVHAASATRRLDGVARCDPRTLAGYVYRDPAGWDVHVAQSDVATLDVTLRTRAHGLAAWGSPRRFTGPSAVEFHHPEPLPEVRYVAWDAAMPAQGER